ncbi:nickel-responsive regulator [Methanobacterium subterraneum]|uniref:Putative nickel-responsive regulator n=1 Tax=Methanobacterium subterraneum TaxID=59277 RepID=A0A2H4V9Z6_9EURY|nr:nickel-responsive transcriptional regulator NikR [Methanobacterium subterraneum]AUB54911.1 nickel-responsive regulator [Methanobacterium subterraneum]
MKASVKISSKLLEEFDEVLHDGGYKSRSKGMRHALKDYILRYQWINEIEGERIGIITVIQDRHFVGAMEDLINVQQDYTEYINAVMHFHMTKTQYLEVIVVKGDVNNIRELTEKVMSLRGVEHVKLTNTGIKEK